MMLDLMDTKREGEGMGGRFGGRGGKHWKGGSCVSRLVKPRGRTCNFNPSNGHF